MLFFATVLSQWGWRSNKEGEPGERRKVFAKADTMMSSRPMRYLLVMTGSRWRSAAAILKEASEPSPNQIGRQVDLQAFSLALHTA
jgi:hypothetical protein